MKDHGVLFTSADKWTSSFFLTPRRRTHSGLPRRPLHQWVCALFFSLGKLAHAQTTSAQCRTALDGMVRDPNYVLAHTRFTDWCRIILENEMANCCTDGDFARGTSEGCTDCSAVCVHQHMDSMCNSYFGKACAVLRAPFANSGAPGLKLRESFCVPEDCTTAADREALMRWYHTSYRAIRTNNWQLDYNDGVLECPSAVATAILAVFVTILGIVLLVWIMIILFKAPPKERGKSTITQAEGPEYPANTAAGFDSDLRRTAEGADTLSSTRVGAS